MNADTVTLELLGRQLQRVLDHMNAFEQNIPLRLKAMDARLDQMDAQLDQMNTRFKLLDARFDQQDLKFQRIEESLDAIANRLVQAIADLKK
jgi:peptidoglycan hydrolase CwlO-like protein